MLRSLVPYISAATTVLAGTTNVLPPELANAALVAASTVGTASMFTAAEPPKFISKLETLSRPENIHGYRTASPTVRALAQIVELIGHIADIIAFNWGRASNAPQKLK